MKARPRVLSLDPAGLLWGSERALLDFIGEIPEFEPAVCCPPKTPLIHHLQARSLPCFPTFQANLHLRGTWARLLALAGLLRALLSYRPGVLHVNQAGATHIALLACRIFKIPCVVHVRLHEDVAYLGCLNVNASSGHLRHVIAISQPIADIIRTTPNLNRIPCTMLLDAYHSRLDSGAAPDSERQRGAKWDFVCVGRFAESKGQRLLVQALSLSQESGASPRVVFVGEVNQHGKDLQKLVRELGLEANVTFAGHRDDVGVILAQSRWLVCPSLWEPLGRVLFEAWDVGIPVIAGRRSGGAAASITSSDGGLLFEEPTPVSLARTLKAALTVDFAAANEMAGRGRVWLLASTDPERYAQAMGSIFRDAIHQFSAQS